MCTIQDSSAGSSRPRGSILRKLKVVADSTVGIGGVVLRNFTIFMLMLIASASVFAQKDPKSASQAKAMTNQDVVALVTAGLPESVVIEKIRTSKTSFDTSTEALVALKKQGVPGGVIRLMVNPGAKPEAAPSAVVSWQGQTQSPEECKAGPGGQIPWLTGASPAMWYSETDGADRVEMQYERGTLHRVGFAGIGATLLILNPINATLRLKRSAVFYSCINPTDAPLVKFSTDKKDNQRDTSVARGGPWNQSFNISEGDIVGISFKKLPQGLFEIRTKTDLPPGEYGFVPQGSVGYFASGERVYAFGVE